jgi:putative acetyltransferase
MQIRNDDLTGEAISNFLREHLADMQAKSPPESVHALDLSALRSPDIAFWSIWESDELVGCGALKELDARSGEIKSMRTAKTHRRQGIAKKMLEHIIGEAQRRSYDCLLLETGLGSEFEPARSLYASVGFEYRGPFGEYIEDVNSVFMTKNL